MTILKISAFYIHCIIGYSENKIEKTLEISKFIQYTKKSTSPIDLTSNFGCKTSGFLCVLNKLHSCQANMS